MPLNSLDDVRPRAAKPSLDGQQSSIAVGAVVKDALVRRFGTLKAAALTMKMDQGQLTRELQTGDFKVEKLDRLNDDDKAFVAEVLHDAFGDADPRAQARRLIRETRARLDELAEIVA
jgi:hypothetical protein